MRKLGPGEETEVRRMHTMNTRLKLCAGSRVVVPVKVRITIPKVSSLCGLHPSLPV